MLKNLLKKLFIKLAKLLFNLFFKINVVRLDRLPKGSNYIICANHSSYLDPPLLIIYLNNEINFIAKKELFRVFFINFFVRLYDCISVDRDNPNPITLKEAIKRLNSNRIVGIFPEGTRVKNLTKSKAYPGVSVLAYYTNKLIVPVKIEGNLNWKSEFLKNLFKLKKHNINIIIKEPININEFVKLKYNFDSINKLPKEKLKDFFQDFADFILIKIYE
ncbi:MAG: 1-acyl-sn-glycerol-3-phosphate acyltransferase [bacterium]|nr:1-acyl-sn-glycerol-3-phosphate acyltransferase [bacterium]